MVDDQIKLWDALYWSTYRLYEQISPYLAIEKARLNQAMLLLMTLLIQQIEPIKRLSLSLKNGYGLHSV